jgi:uncharacterized protein (TIGR02246 family)
VSLPVQDIIAIQQLASRYNHAVDSGDGAGFAAAFVADGVLDSGTGDPLKGSEALSAFAPVVASSMPGIRHVVANAVIDGEGDKATMKAYLLVLVKGETGPVPMATGTYQDELIRQDGEWRFVHRLFTAD